MKSTICSFRPLRKFLLAGAVLFSPYLLTHSTASEVCVRQKTVSTQTRFSIDLRNATLEEFRKASGTENRLPLHLRRRSTPELPYHPERTQCHPSGDSPESSRQAAGQLRDLRKTYLVKQTAHTAENR